MSKRNKYLIYGAIAIAVVGFFVIRGNTDAFAGDERLQIEITSPSARRSVTEAEVTVTGIVSNPAAIVEVEGVRVDVSADGGFTHRMELDYGSNRLSIRASGEGFRETTRSVSVPRAMVLEILEPDSEAVASSNMITVAGTVSDAGATITVAGIDVAVADDGTWSIVMSLYYPLTILNVTASREGIDPITEQISVTADPDAVSAR